MVYISVIVDEGKVKASKSSKNDRCKTDKILSNICNKCRYVLLLSDTTTITKQPDISDKSDDSIQQNISAARCLSLSPHHLLAFSNWP